MKRNLKYLFAAITVFTFIILTFINLHSYPNGFIGVTKKTGGVGCICHTPTNTPAVNVFFIGPDSVAAGSSVYYKLKIIHSIGVTGGFDIAVLNGTLDTAWVDPAVKKDISGELTQIYPKPFVNDSVSWTFKYTAPSSVQVDTLYAIGNSTNNNYLADTTDKWNYTINYPIKVYIPIGIANNTQKAEDFNLSQNYPNPFNPSTNIEYSVNKKGYIKLSVFDISAKEIAVLFEGIKNEGSFNLKWNASNLSSGIYFLKLASESVQSVKKMILLK
jgi:hypothetical protein